MKSKFSDDTVEELLKPYLDQLPQAPNGFRVSHGLGNSFATFMPLAEVYDKNGRTGQWERMLYTDQQQALIKRLDQELDAKMDAWTVEFVSNNEVLQKVLKEQPRLRKKYDRAYKRVDNTEGFNNYLCESQDYDDDLDIVMMSDIESIVHAYCKAKPIKHVLWDDLVDYTDIMSRDYAEMESEYAA
jgi:hypothetical protein